MANTALSEVLNDLIRINNDRIEGYEKAITEADDIDVDLKAIFSKMENDSRDNVRELTAAVQDLGEAPAEGTTVSGMIYRTWMDVRTAFSSKERQSILELCEFGEDAAQKAYNEALASDAEMSTTIRQMITGQQQSLRTSHDVIKKYLDLHKVL
ncbi:ferritin-like domain-containing protein [Flavihumibacter fluvii]|uniref:ferritin-like domain-containing protein n=1 Tax=Flavihumibacter fluvii TaxID=2838157 RepID=UPI001BDF187B|nr:PA2169 family four-helix-bundle protein [Flavihumibacter fluvii]ULQ51883.1 PA2169 family four-helix-bundle protein [Flavihumibacter fluvii]